MTKSSDLQNEASQEIVMTYQDQLQRARDQRLSMGKNVLEEAKKNIRQHFKKIKYDLKETLELWESTYLTQYQQLAEIREIVDGERSALEELYHIKIPPDSLGSIISIKREKRQNLEEELSQRRRAVEADMDAKKQRQEQQLEASLQRATALLKTYQDQLKTIESEIAHRIQTKETAIQLKEKELEERFEKKRREQEVVLQTLSNDLKKETHLLEKRRVERQLEFEEAKKYIEDMLNAKKQEMVVKEKQLEVQHATLEEKSMELVEKDVRLTLWQEDLEKQTETLKANIRDFEAKLLESEKKAEERITHDYHQKLQELQQEFKKKIAQKNQDIHVLQDRLAMYPSGEVSSQDYRLPLKGQKEPLRIVRPMKG